MYLTSWTYVNHLTIKIQYLLSNSIDNDLTPPRTSHNKINENVTQKSASIIWIHQRLQTKTAIIIIIISIYIKWKQEVNEQHLKKINNAITQTQIC
jgi:hypothetical protein